MSGIAYHPRPLSVRSATMASRLKAVAASLCLAVAAISIGGSAFLGIQYLDGNFHQVVAGELYRSGQPTAERIAQYVHEKGIKTIINLRGSNPKVPWYEAEVAESARLGVTHIDFAMSAKRELTYAQAGELLQLLRNAPKPILIHCEGGADRTGLASALYLAGIKRSGEESAESQMSLRFGHIALPFLGAYAMDRTFESLEASFGYSDS